jgi:transposase-like protein
MPRPSKYPPEFRERCVRIARESERPIAAVARDLGLHPETLRVWVPSCATCYTSAGTSTTPPRQSPSPWTRQTAHGWPAPCSY